MIYAKKLLLIRKDVKELLVDREIEGLLHRCRVFHLGGSDGQYLSTESLRRLTYLLAEVLGTAAICSRTKGPALDQANACET